MMSPDSMPGMKPPNRCRSEPQIAHEVILMIASRGSSIFGSGTVSYLMSFLPCQQRAFIAGFLQRVGSSRETA
jgi:hypothetical protein